MKKIVYSLLAFVFVFTGVNLASADKIIVPLVYHYGNSNYSQVNIKNNAAEAVRVSVVFNAEVVNSSGVASNTSSSSGVSRTAVIAPSATWTLLTKDTDLWGATTSIKRNQVVIQSSATNVPSEIGVGQANTGPLSVGALFIAADSSGNVSGFTFPAFYKTRTWATVDATQFGIVDDLSGTRGHQDNWEQ